MNVPTQRTRRQDRPKVPRIGIYDDLREAGLAGSLRSPEDVNSMVDAVLEMRHLGLTSGEAIRMIRIAITLCDGDVKKALSIAIEETKVKIAA